MPTRSETSAPAVAREAEILDAARQVFARKGYDETRIQDVADACGIAKGTVYLYFRSKEELYWATVRRGFEELHRRSREALLAVEEAGARAGSPTRAKLRAFIVTRLSFFAEQGDFFRLYFGELGQALVRQGAALAQLRDLYLAQVEILRGIVEAGIAGGELRPVAAEAAAASILDLVRGRVARRLQGWSALGPDAELEELLSFIWEGIGR